MKQSDYYYKYKGVWLNKNFWNEDLKTCRPFISITMSLVTPKQYGTSNKGLYLAYRDSKISLSELKKKRRYEINVLNKQCELELVNFQDYESKLFLLGELYSVDKSFNRRKEEKNDEFNEFQDVITSRLVKGKERLAVCRRKRDRKILGFCIYSISDFKSGGVGNLAFLRYLTDASLDNIGFWMTYAMTNEMLEHQGADFVHCGSSPINHKTNYHEDVLVRKLNFNHAPLKVQFTKYQFLDYLVKLVGKAIFTLLQSEKRKLFV